MKKQRPLIGIIINEADKEYYNRSVYCLQRELFAADMDVAIFSSLLSIDDEKYTKADCVVYDLLDSELIDGYVIYPYSIYSNEPVKNAIIERLKKSGKPVVSADACIEGLVCDNYDLKGAVDCIVSHVADCHGAKTVDYVGGPPSDDYHRLLDELFVASLREHGCELPESRIHHGTDWDTGYEAIADEIIRSGMPQAIVCCSDITANGIIAVLSERGLYDPRKTIVTGFSKNEPYAVSDPICVTSVERDSGSMSVNAARHIISAVRGTEYVPSPTDGDFKLVKGTTCGCRSDITGELAKKALYDATHVYSDFDSPYNFMSEELIGCDNLTDYMWKLKWYRVYLGDIKGFWLCLNNKVMHEVNPPTAFTEKMNLALDSTLGEDAVDPERFFDIGELLPAITEPRDKPSAFIFTSLHFFGSVYGYTVLSYGDSGRIYGRQYLKWLRTATCALEKQHHHIIYNDTVTDAQIRDTLTGLFNMRGYTRIMKERCGSSYDGDKLLRIVSVDVDNLKGINDAYGYSEGDKLLTKIAVMLSGCVEDSDICVRVSRDEFLIAGIIDRSCDESDDIMESLNRSISMLNTDSGPYGVSLFTSRVTAPLTSADVIEKLPYEASYQRQLNKDNHAKMHKTADAVDEKFDPEERGQVLRLLNENLFTYHFQPIVNARTGDIFAYEALMRSGDQFKLSPITILNHAQALDRLYDIEKYTMMNIFGILKRNSEKFKDKYLFVNSIPSRTLDDADFEQLFRLYGDVMDRSFVEFTEQTEASEENLHTLLERSKRSGFKIAVDDYGTGYSNISNLLTFMPNCVKIDRSLIMNIHKDKRKQHFTRNIIDYAHDNHFMALAEGVELSEELKTVIYMGVDLIQGYYTAKPSAEIVPEINRAVFDEIREYNRLSENRRPQKTYFAGAESEISLMTLEFDNYTEIVVNKPEYTIKGNSNFVSEAVIKVMDNNECRLNLVDIDMKNDSAGACVTVGANSRLILNICGKVSISGAIEVPAGSSLEIVGDGELSLSSSANHTYAIGAGTSRSYGNITIRLNNSLSIHLDSDRSVAIGGVFNESGSKIDVEAKKLMIEQLGKVAVGIGSINGSSDVTIKNTDVTLIAHTAKNLGMGSINGSSNIHVDNCKVNEICSGDVVGLAGCLGDNNCTVEFCSSSVRGVFNGKIIRAFGCGSGNADIGFYDTYFDCTCSGANAICMGSNSRTGRIAFNNCGGSLSVNSSTYAVYSVPEEAIYKERYRVEVHVNE